MTRYDKRVIALAVCLSALAGYVDALGFLKLNGFFVSFMSGNSTRLAVGLARGAPDAAMAAGLIVVFVVGVVLGSLTGHFAGARRRPAVLGGVALLLALAAGLNALGASRGAVIAMGLAMGAENAVFEEDGEVRIGLTYMTGTLVKVGQRLATALRGGSPFAWASYLWLWVGLAAGGIAGAVSYSYVGLGGLWVAAVIAAGLAVVSIGPIGPVRRR
jgi:uncharacterized membrane protein YoaK (UPF0700 family)